MKSAIRGLDALLRRRLGVFEFCDAPDCVLRVRVAPAMHPIVLPDRLVPRGAAVLDLHLWNEHVPAMPPAGPDLAWALTFQRRLILSFRALAGHVPHDSRMATAQAVGGVTVLLLPGDEGGSEKLLRRLGFTVFPYHSPLGRFGEFWENLFSWWIMWTYNPASLRQRRFTRLQRTEVWMTMTAFLGRYGREDFGFPVLDFGSRNLSC
jgi:hypothetical protein